MSTDGPQHVYRVRLDFMYQSIAVYAVTMIIYLIVRSFGAIEQFPSIWQDPLLLLLSAITLISVLALIYNLLMHRKIEIRNGEIWFSSRAHRRSITRHDVTYVQFGSRERPHNRRGIRVVRIGVAGRRLPVRIRLANFERSNELLADIREWAGPIAQIGRGRRSRRLIRPTTTSPGASASEARPSGL